MRYFLNSFLLSTLIVLAGIPVLAGPIDEAERLTTQGHQYLRQGSPGNAIETWLKALQIYQKENSDDGEKSTLIHLSLAYRAKGQYPNACWVLTDALEIDDSAICRNVNRPTAEEVANALKIIKEQPDTLLTLKALQELGITLRVIGNLDESVSVLELALASAQRQNLGLEQNAIRMSLANVQADMIRQAQNRFSLSDNPLTKAQFIEVATSTLPDVSKTYLELASTEPMFLRARLNWLKLFLSINQWANQDPTNPDLVSLKASLIPQLNSTLNQALLADYSTESPILSVYRQIKLAKYLLEIQKSDLPVTTEKHILLLAFELANSARNDALSLRNKRAESFAVGVSGLLYKTTKQDDFARRSFKAARDLAVSSNSADSAYEWEWELAKLYQAQDQTQEAILAYERSIKHLDQLRSDLLPIDSELQFRFADKIKPVYQQYISLLLESGTPEIEKVVLTNERLQVAQIENFLHCGKLDFISVTQIQDTPTIIQILELENKIELLIRSNQTWQRFTLDATKVRKSARKLLFNLQDKRLLYTDENVLLSDAQTLYQLLLAPVERQGLLPPEESTIVFVADGILSNIPPAIFHDGQKYLIERYSLSSNLGTQLQPPSPLDPKKLKILIAGLSEQGPSFTSDQVPSSLTALPEVNEEVDRISKKFNSSILLNKNFTADNFKRKLSGDYPILHISTHGQFSSDPDQTFLLAWDQPLKLQGLDTIIRQGTQVAANPLELLFLSACQSAKGDQLSSLGIAGISIQAGAKSTIASLWLVEAQSTAELAEQFYESLLNGQTKAEALRDAQLKLLKSPDTQHPYFWSSFLLSGSWL
ncbi:CHAT domain-containing protein [Acaryochloris marina NIES-2412]|uniref:CHAT domain-containing protein n=1 Tax=Acaryochloris marina TaxID=155978 RepID=UPI004058D36A